MEQDKDATGETKDGLNSMFFFLFSHDHLPGAAEAAQEASDDHGSGHELPIGVVAGRSGVGVRVVRGAAQPRQQERRQHQLGVPPAADAILFGGARGLLRRLRQSVPARSRRSVQSVGFRADRRNRSRLAGSTERAVETQTTQHAADRARRVHHRPRSRRRVPDPAPRHPPPGYGLLHVCGQSDWFSQKSTRQVVSSLRGH